MTLAALIWHPAARPLSGGVRQYAEAPRQGGEGRQDERERIARPGLLAALPSQPGRGDGEEDEAGRMADRRGDALLLVDRRRGGGDDIAQKRTG